MVMVIEAITCRIENSPLISFPIRCDMKLC
jgi:hypothetical protein